VFKRSEPVPLRPHSKAAALFYQLALRPHHAAARSVLLEALWPNMVSSFAQQSLNTLTYSLHKQLGEAIGGAAPILHDGGAYRLNAEAGVAIDVTWFDMLVKSGDDLYRTSSYAAAIGQYRHAVNLYRGDLGYGSDDIEPHDLSVLIERERLRACYLRLLATLADHAFRQGEYAGSLDLAQKLLASDPLREDAHRLAMRCYVRLGERGQALRQFRLCTEILRAEFDATPEPSTAALFEQIRSDPASI
jgi:DNA-binding SARP family transcriptional activator